MPHHPIKNPVREADRARKNLSDCLAALDSVEITLSASEIQQRRAIWIARRSNISIIHAGAIAALAFGTEAAR
jgi:hypothetical protein